MSAQPDFALNTTLCEQMRAIVGAAHVLVSRAEDALIGLQPKFVLEPGTHEELARVLQIANELGLAVIPRGGGTKLQWGNRPRAADIVVSTARLNRIVEHAWEDLTVTVDAGCTVKELQRTLAEHGQRLAIDVLWPERATIGGILATNDGGSLRARFGGLRDLIIGITIVLPDGTIAKSGGKVVKNVAGYDLMKLATGALGTLGVIARAVFRLHPLPTEQRTITFMAADAEQATRFLLDVSASNLVYTGLQVRCGSGLEPAIDVRFEGTLAGIDAQIDAVTRMGSYLKATSERHNPWQAREDLCPAGQDEIIAKLSFLPADFAQLHRALSDIAASQGVTWSLVAYSHGLGWMRLKTASSPLLPSVVSDLRATIRRCGGSMVVLECPAQTRGQIEAWGDVGNAAKLMRCIKQQFDPRGTLNPGRFAGGI